VVASFAELPDPAPRAAATPARGYRRVIVTVVALDASVIALAIVLALVGKFGTNVWPPPQIDWFTGVPLIDFGWLLPVWVASLALSEGYSRRHFAHGSDEVKAVLRGSAVAAGVCTMLAYLVNYDMSRGFFGYSFLLGTALLLAERLVVRRALRRLRARDQFVRRVVAVGDPASLRELDRALARHPDLGYRLVGTCSPSTEQLRDGVPVLGSPADCVAACLESGADTLLIASGSLSSSVDLRHIGWELDGHDVDLIVVPSLIDVAGPRIHMRPVAGLPFVHVEPPQAARAMHWRKAAFDRLGAALLLLAGSPLFLLIALAIKLDSRGPVFFRHRRVGLNGGPFEVWKFRSMATDAAARHDDLVTDNGGVALLFKLREDPRITRVGRLIRRWSLDELPQLLNVLRGEMSLVGPRPQVDEEVACYEAATHRRLLVRPGLTGLWQVSGRSNLSLDEAQRLDLYYVENWSMLSDLVILAKTVGAVLRRDGAY
jgi:exopolysaccharide biosynthesis polyprenyl glycosylphosphotransferase